MTIIDQSKGEFSKRDVYHMTRDGRIKSLKDVADGSIIDVDKYMIYEDINSDGAPVQILSIMDKDGNVFACTSPTFKQSFLYIVDLMDGDDFSVVKTSGKSKSDRSFIDCALV